MKNTKITAERTALLALAIALVFAGFGIGTVAADNVNDLIKDADDNLSKLLADQASLEAIQAAIAALQGSGVDNQEIVTDLNYIISHIQMGNVNPEMIYLGDVYLFALYDKTTMPSTLTSQDGSRTIIATNEPGNNQKIAFIANSDAAGVYYYYNSNGQKCIVNVKYPSVKLSGVVTKAGTTDKCALFGGTVDIKDKFTISVGSIDIDGETVYPTGIYFTNPSNTLSSTTIPGVTQTAISATETEYSNLGSMELGTWTVQSVYSGNNEKFSEYAPSYMLGEEYYFTVIEAVSPKTIVASKDAMIQGEYVTVTVLAPYGYWIVAVDENRGYIPPGQVHTTEYTGLTGQNAAKIKVGTSGDASLVIRSTSPDDMKISLYTEDGATLVKQITVKVTPGAITATAREDKVHIGNEFDIYGTNDFGGTLYFYFKGSGYPLTYLDKSASGKLWSKTFDSKDFGPEPGKKPAAGSYTIYVAQLKNGITPSSITSPDLFDDETKVEAYTTVSIALVQPFITVETIDTVIQGGKLEITGTAEGNPREVGIYVFGTNFFKATSVRVSGSTYSFSQKITSPDEPETDAWQMPAGHYYVVVQHSMYDDKFNVATTKGTIGANIVKDTTTGWTSSVINKEEGTIIFNTNAKQSAEAAKALEEAISDENHDDMQAHTDFTVTEAHSEIDAIPPTVVKGQILTISGTTAGHQYEVVSVEMQHTASSEYYTKSTRIDAKDLWSVSFDTSQMVLGSYTISITVGQLDPQTASTKIIDGSTAGAILYSGWNVVSVPKKLDSAYDTAAEFFAGVDTANHPILSYNAQTKSWEQVTGSTVISPLNAYWIYSTSEKSLAYKFSTAVSTPAVKSVYKGWNAVGLSADEPLAASVAFGNTNWYTYLEWNAPSQTFKTPMIKNGSGIYADTNSVSLWTGGWLFVNEDGTLMGFTA